jgi:two-component system CheB/CheR fusion protein
MKSSPRKPVKSSHKAPTAINAKVSSKMFPIVGIGASAGGLEAFSELLRYLPEKTGMAFVLVQHLDPKHESGLQEILARTTKIPVTEVTHGMVVQPDQAYVIPANTYLTINNGVLQLGTRVLTRGQHMPIDGFFHSLAENSGQQAIGVILSGAASDGTEGCRAIKAAGGITFAQNEETAKYDSMPRSAVNAGCIDFILPPKDIARELGGISQHPYVARAVGSEMEGFEGMVGSDLNALFGLLRDSSGVDFTNYKHNTLQRRIRRRMVVHKIEKLKDYLRLIGKKPEELDELYRDLLIHVTGFFREPEPFWRCASMFIPNYLKAASRIIPFAFGLRAVPLAKRLTQSLSRFWNTCGFTAGTFRKPPPSSRFSRRISAIQHWIGPVQASTRRPHFRRFQRNDSSDFS